MDTAGVYFPFLLFVVGVATGFVGTMGGSGGLLLLPFMIAAGIPPASALGTARLAAIPAWVIALVRFSRAGQVRWKQLPLITAIALVSGAIGTYMIIGIEERYVYPIVGTLLVLISPLAMLNKNLGLVAREVGPATTKLGYALYFLVMIYGGFFGAGTGVMAMSVMVLFLGFRAFEAHATEIAAWIVMSVLSASIFIMNDRVDYFLAFVLVVSTALGSYIGSHWALKGGDKWIKIVVCVFSFIMGIKLLVWG